MQRRMIVAGVLIAALTLVAGCASAVGEPPPSTSTTGIGSITFAIGSDDISWLKPVIDTWNAEHPHQQVTPLYLPQDANVQLDQLVANLQAKSPVYDVIDMDVVWTAEFAANGWILQLNPDDFPLGDFFASAVHTAEYQYHLYAVPDYTNADLLYYRTDVLAKAHVPLPRPGSTWTWAQLARLASTVAPRYGLSGYAATFAQYEGLTVNFAEAVQSAGGSILNSKGAVAVDTPQAQAGLGNLVSGFDRGWIPQQTLRYEETQAQDAFEQGKFLFLNDWPDAYSVLSTPRTDNKVYGKFGVAALPGQAGPGVSTLGGANLAISAYSLHQRTALDFIKYLTETDQQKTMLELGSFPPVLRSLYGGPGLTARFPYLPTLYQAIETAQPRPAITNYDQASLDISSEVYQALEKNKTPQDALHDMQSELTQIIRDGLAESIAERQGAEQGPARLARPAPPAPAGPTLSARHKDALPCPKSNTKGRHHESSSAY